MHMQFFVYTYTVSSPPTFHYNIVPGVNPQVVQINPFSGKLHYTCDFVVQPDDKKMMFNVEWRLHNGLQANELLHSATETKLDEATFKKTTMLRREHLEKKGVHKLGYTASKTYT